MPARLVLLLLAALFGVVRVSPADPAEERIAFDAAVRALEDGFVQKAASDLADFFRTYPESRLAPRAILLEARARVSMGDPASAAELIRERVGALAEYQDQGLYLLGEINLRRGHLAEAADAFRSLAALAPDSSLLLNAGFNEAMALFRAGDFAQAAAILGDPTHVFARSAAEQPDSPVAIHGTLLLAESLLRTGEPDQARAVLEPLADRSLNLTQAWDRQWLLTSMHLTNRHTDAALASASNLLATARQAGSRDLEARTHVLTAEIHRQAGQVAQAFAALTNNLSADTPAPWRRDALLAITQLPLNPPQLGPAIELLSSFTSRPPGDPVGTAARVAVAELSIQRHYVQPSAATTRSLESAAQLLQTVLSNNPAPPLAGRAWFDLGWIRLANAGLPAATEAFSRASDLLEGSPLHAFALFKLADCQQQAGQHALALTNYLRVVRHYGGQRPVRGAVLERALYQGAVAALEAGDEATANELAHQAVTQFPNGEFRDDTRVLYGQTLARIDPPVRAQESLAQIATRLTNSPALPEIQLALARSHFRAGSWSNALHHLDNWTRAYPNHFGIARAEFERAWAAYKTGDNQRAYELFTSFLNRFPNHPAAPQAHLWVGNHLYRLGGTNLVAAEMTYQIVFQRTNWPVSRITHEARLMAGRAAFARQTYKDAKTYFRWFIENGPPANTNSLIPPELVAQAYFAYGDCFIEDPESDDKLSDAMSTFVRLIEQFPNTREALLARGKLADCHLQRASLDPGQAASAYANAEQLYLQLIAAPAADINTRSQAEVQLGFVLEKQAALASADRGRTLLDKALAHYLNVFHGRNLRPSETASAFWLNRAGVEAARLAESREMRSQAVEIYEKLARTFPAAAEAFRKRAAQIRNPGTG